MENPTVSVVVPVLNREQTIGNCIKSLVRQRLREKFEIIIVDNGSTDNTVSIAMAFSDKVRLVRDFARGAYHARNSGVANSAGKLIAFTDSDCIANQDWLSLLVRPFKDNSIKLVGGCIKAVKVRNYVESYCNAFCLNQQFFCSSSTPYFATANLAVRKKDFEKIGGFDSRLMSCSDLAFCLRIHENGGKLFYEPRATIRHYYPSKLLDFVRKQYYYGKWNGIVSKQLGFQAKSALPSYARLLKEYGFRYLPMRIAHDTSFWAGLIVGNVLVR
jgi:glycosyltransferase involved in cell wall biosynthesis